jgi:hypothetical protein
MSRQRARRAHHTSPACSIGRLRSTVSGPLRSCDACDACDEIKNSKFKIQNSWFLTHQFPIARPSSP